MSTSERVRFFVAMLAVGCLGVGCGGGSETSSPREAASDEFFQLVEMKRGDFDPLSLEGMARDADLVVAGTIIDVVEGPVYIARQGQDSAAYTVLARVEVDSAFSREEERRNADSVYVRFETPPSVDARVWREAVPEQRVLLFLRDLATFPSAAQPTDNLDAIPSTGMYITDTPLGLLVESADQGLVTALEDHGEIEFEGELPATGIDALMKALPSFLSTTTDTASD